MSKIYLTWDKLFTVVEFPLHNNGVICWFNSLVQFLLGISNLSKKLILHKRNLHNNKFAMSYINLIEKTLSYADPEFDNNEDIMKNGMEVFDNFILQLKNMGKDVKLYGQECTNEAFTMFIDAFKSQPIDQLFSCSYSRSIICNKCNAINYYKRDDSFIIGITSEEPLDNYDKLMSWISKNYSQAEGVECLSCHQKMNSTWCDTLKKVGEVIILMFPSYYSKKCLYYPDELIFNPHAESKKLHFKVVSNIEHVGSANSGHYWSNSIRSMNSVMKLNDSRISPGDLKHNENVYMVAYAMITK